MNKVLPLAAMALALVVAPAAFHAAHAADAAGSANATVKVMPKECAALKNARAQKECVAKHEKDMKNGMSSTPTAH